MHRTARASRGGYVYHVLNRGNARQDVFHKDEDFAAFVNGEAPWQHQAAKKLGLEASLRPCGRPRKKKK